MEDITISVKKPEFQEIEDEAAAEQKETSICIIYPGFNSRYLALYSRKALLNQYRSEKFWPIVNAFRLLTVWGFTDILSPYETDETFDEMVEEARYVGKKLPKRERDYLGFEIIHTVKKAIDLGELKITPGDYVNAAEFIRWAKSKKLLIPEVLQDLDSMSHAKEAPPKGEVHPAMDDYIGREQIIEQFKKRFNINTWQGVLYFIKQRDFSIRRVPPNDPKGKPRISDVELDLLKEHPGKQKI